MIEILHLEDSDSDAKLISAALLQGLAACRVTRVETHETFQEAVVLGKWDIILADYSLPGFDGISALNLAIEKRPELPFIFVTGSLGEERAVATLKSGATDYILKHNLDRLPQAIMRALRESASAQARKEAEELLKASLHEKEVLLQEVHHRVNNNLQIICSLLNIQAGAVEDPLLTSILLEGQQRVQSMAMIHAMLYSSGSLKEIEFGKYAYTLAAAVANAYRIDPKRIRLSFELEPLRFEIDRAIPCGLILNELLSNAFKYAFPAWRTGEVRVSLQQVEDSVRLAVEDDGVGMPESWSLKDSKSLGLTLVAALTKQLGGNLQIRSEQGAHFIVTLSRGTAAGQAPGAPLKTQAAAQGMTSPG